MTHAKLVVGNLGASRGEGSPNNTCTSQTLEESVKGPLSDPTSTKQRLPLGSLQTTITMGAIPLSHERSAPTILA